MGAGQLAWQGWGRWKATDRAPCSLLVSVQFSYRNAQSKFVAFPVLNNPSLLICLKNPLPVENTFLAANVTGCWFKCPTAGRQRCRQECGAQAELMRLGESSQQLSSSGRLASQEES